ncbi:MAG: hypothetical protein H7832_12180 [Magnetococcus sp. DMHC-6]
MQKIQMPFLERWGGSFEGMVRLEDAKQLGHKIAELDGWFLLDPKVTHTQESVSGSIAWHLFEKLIAEILREEQGVWSTMVYVQSREDPWLIKVFHPRRAGCGCGGGGGGGSGVILPWWIFSRIPPPEEPIDQWFKPTCAIKPSRWVSFWKG